MPPFRDIKAYLNLGVNPKKLRLFSIPLDFSKILRYSNPMDDTLLSVENLKTYFRTPDGLARAVDGISFDIKPNEIFALVGESGCGKSVTALSIIQLIAQPAGFIADGAINYKGQDITRLSEVEKRKIQGNDIAMIFQEPMTSLNPVFTIGNQISEAIQEHQDLRGAAARNAAIEMLDRVGIPEPAARYDEYPHQMSGGMKQRVMIAMALSCRPGLLIADEPTTALDVTIQAQILELIQRLQQELQMAVLLITHDLGVVANIADRVAVMYAGKIAEIGTWKQLYETPQHPYTVKLLESTPARDKRGTELHTISGRVPKATEYNDGCRFADRCPRVMDGCDTLAPTLHTVNGSEHRVACHLYNPEPPFNAKLTGNTKLVIETGEQDGKVGTHPSILPSFPPSNLLQVKNLCVHYPIQRGSSNERSVMFTPLIMLRLIFHAAKRSHSSENLDPARPPLVKQFSGWACLLKATSFMMALTSLRPPGTRCIPIGKECKLSSKIPTPPLIRGCLLGVLFRRGCRHTVLGHLTKNGRRGSQN